MGFGYRKVKFGPYMATVPTASRLPPYIPTTLWHVAPPDKSYVWVTYWLLPFLSERRAFASLAKGRRYRNCHHNGAQSW
jgi:hypothetical protein